MKFTEKFVALAAISSANAVAIPEAEAMAMAMALAQNEPAPGVPVSCYMNCGPGIVAGRGCNGDLECLCGDNSQFKRMAFACLDCIAGDWVRIGPSLTPFLEQCGFPTSPEEYAAQKSASSSAEPSTVEPSSEGPSSADPTSADPTSADPTSADPTSADPTSADPTSADPTSADPTSAAASSSAAPSSSASIPDPNDKEPVPGIDPTCYMSCGTSIVTGRNCNGDQECLCGENSEFRKLVFPCLACMADDWVRIGPNLTPFLEQCGFPTSPEEYASQQSTAIPTSGQASATSDSPAPSSTDSTMPPNSCFVSCGSSIVAGRECNGDKDCICGQGSLFNSYIFNCLSCAGPVWGQLGKHLEPFLEQCGYPLNPDAYATASIPVPTQTGPAPSDSPDKECHSVCGNAIIAAGDECSNDSSCYCANDSTYMSLIYQCLDCGAGLWKWYGKHLTGSLAACGLPESPEAYAALKSSSSAALTQSTTSESATSASSTSSAIQSESATSAQSSVSEPASSSASSEPQSTSSVPASSESQASSSVPVSSEPVVNSTLTSSWSATVAPGEITTTATEDEQVITKTVTECKENGSCETRTTTVTVCKTCPSTSAAPTTSSPSHSVTTVTECDNQGKCAEKTVTVTDDCITTTVTKCEQDGKCSTVTSTITPSGSKPVQPKPTGDKPAEPKPTGDKPAGPGTKTVTEECYTTTVTQCNGDGECLTHTSTITITPSTKPTQPPAAPSSEVPKEHPSSSKPVAPTSDTPKEQQPTPVKPVSPSSSQPPLEQVNKASNLVATQFTLGLVIPVVFGLLI